MPSHYVRFSSTNTFHSPPPPLMSRASSSASSFGPLTPPSFSYGGAPGPTSYAPQSTYTKSSLRKGRAHRLTSAGFTEPAVHPPQASITLVTPHLPWAIGVPASNGAYVTVFDVLNSIYNTLRVSATQGELNALGSQNMARASAAYIQRYRRLRGHHSYTEEKWGGIKRVDFLMGYTRMYGLSPTESPDVWQLNTG
ncbi:hypothetical protein B0H11DRAFT_2163375 [Mycena galericulata]|nr:hypothetical protein B0H11DRAFT_2163375 [Mycena galericulata]